MLSFDPHHPTHQTNDADNPDDEEQRHSLAAPLLSSGDPMTTVHHGSSRRHLYYHPGSSSSSLLHRIVAMRCLADRLPWIFHSIVVNANGKIVPLALLGINLLFVSLWVPFWLLSFLLTEWGVYATAVGTIFLVGRAIIRLIAFPGASQKVTIDMEAEFAKYSVQMITSATDCLIELGNTLGAVPDNPTTTNNNNGSSSKNTTLHQLPNLWRRVKGYRDRVLGVFLDVLLYIYNPEDYSNSSLTLSATVDAAPSTTTTPDDPLVTTVASNGYGPGLTRYGNNRFSGDIGHFNGLTVRLVGFSVIFYCNPYDFLLLFLLLLTCRSFSAPRTDQSSHGWTRAFGSVAAGTATAGRFGTKRQIRAGRWLGKSQYNHRANARHRQKHQRIRH